MNNRLELSDILHGICDHVYFQPSESYQMKFPCIVYQRRTGDTFFADNKPYIIHQCYTVTVIDSDPDSEIPMRVAELPMCKFDRTYSVDNLYHSTFILYY